MMRRKLAILCVQIAKLPWSCDLQRRPRMHCKLIGVPLQDGASRLGCEMGPSALRVAGLGTALRDLGHEVTDLGNLAPPAAAPVNHPNEAIRNLPLIAAWTDRKSVV